MASAEHGLRRERIVAWLERAGKASARDEDLERARIRGWIDRVNRGLGSVDESGGATTVQHEQLTQYLDYLRDALKETLSQMRRSLLLMFLLALVFALFQTRTLEDVSLGPIKITSRSELVVFLPTLIAYFLFELRVKSAQAFQRVRP